MRHKVSADLIVDTNEMGFRTVMKSAGVQRLLAYEAMRAKLRAEAVSGLKFGSGVDLDGRYVSALGWVGASSIDHKRGGRFNAGLHAKQVEALSQALHGV